MPRKNDFIGSRVVFFFSNPVKKSTEDDKGLDRSKSRFTGHGHEAMEPKGMQKHEGHTHADKDRVERES